MRVPSVSGGRIPQLPDQRRQSSLAAWLTRYAAWYSSVLCEVGFDIAAELPITGVVTDLVANALTVGQRLIGIGEVIARAHSDIHQVTPPRRRARRAEQPGHSPRHQRAPPRPQRRVSVSSSQSSFVLVIPA